MSLTVVPLILTMLYFVVNVHVFIAYIYGLDHYKKATHSKLRSAFNNVYRRILKLHPRSNASAMKAENHMDILARKRIVDFIERLCFERLLQRQ